jgi:bifunctional NMN adenylyltransferase/nudix hydrolase
MRKHKYDLAVFVGRFQPFHNGHVQNITKALDIADQVLVILGSANQPRTIKNPFTVTERHTAIKDLFPDDNVAVTTVEDTIYQETRWVQMVQSRVHNHIIRSNLILNVTPDADDLRDPADAKVVILGYEKDESSYYLKRFPTWDFYDIGAHAQFGGRPIDATKIREMFFEGHFGYMTGVLPDSVFKGMMAFTESEDYKQLVREYNYIRDYKRSWKDVPYPVTFFTTDAVVIQSGHLLLVKRRAEPGKGLWALPGGFLSQHERAFDSAIRELKEETKLKVPEAVLRGSCKMEKLFDHPERSLRGRTITQAFLFDLPDQNELPKVKGGDDAVEARWFPLDQVEKMTNQLFEDHKSIIELMTTRTD